MTTTMDSAFTPTLKKKGWILTVHDYLLSDSRGRVSLYDTYEEAGEAVSAYFNLYNSPCGDLRCLGWVRAMDLLILNEEEFKLPYFTVIPINLKLVTLKVGGAKCYGIPLSLAGKQARKRVTISPLWTKFKWDRNKNK